MKEAFEIFLFEKLAVHRQSKFLLAVSGGMDSMCMWHLFRRCGLKFIVAHCNFQLRKKESMMDEEFVKAYANSNEIVFTKRFDTKAYSEENSLSTQMAARELRYKFFEELKDEHGCDYIVTAHHLDDQVETFFIRLFRNSSLQSFSGIPSKTDTLLRPMMFTGRESIEHYVENHEVPFREDESNATDAYLRNRIRKSLIPAMQKVLPNFKNSVIEVMQNMKDVSDSFDDYVEKRKIELLRYSDQEIRITINDLMKIELPNLFLEVYLRQLGFAKSVIKNLIQALSSDPGRTFYSKNYRIIKDREDLIILPLVLENEDEIIINKNELLLNNIYFLQSQLLEKKEQLLKNVVPGSALLDFDKLEEIITFRKWKHGDFFFPLGLGGRKKISDYFVDSKYSLADKERQWIMLSGSEICWIVGRIIDDRYKIRENTKLVLLLEQE